MGGVFEVVFHKKLTIGTLLRGAIISLGLVVATFGNALAHAGHVYQIPEIGEPGVPKSVKRTVTITIQGNAFQPTSISVRPGETVRFRIVNKSEFLHEFSIGSASMHIARQRELRSMLAQGRITATAVQESQVDSDVLEIDAQLERINSAFVEPGKSTELIWRFASEMDLECACNMPDHYQSGMVGGIAFRK